MRRGNRNRWFVILYKACVLERMVEVMRKTALLLLCAAVWFGGCACSERAETDSSVSDVVQVQVDYPVTVGGREISECPSSVVSLAPAITEAICTLGSVSQLSGVSDGWEHPDLPADLPRLGTAAAVDIDALLALAPQLVLAPDTLSDMVAAELENAGVAVVKLHLPAEWRQVSEFYTQVAQVVSGLTTGQNNAEATISRLTAQIQQICGRYTVPDGMTAAVISAYGVAVAGNGTIAHQLLTWCGLQNSCASSMFVPQELAAAQPDLVFCDTRELEAVQMDAQLSGLRIMAVDLQYARCFGEQTIGLAEQICTAAFMEE